MQKNFQTLIKTFKLTELTLIAMPIIICACSSTPNSVSMSATTGTCVQDSQYNSPPSTIKANPNSAPYCLAVTITNNNNGSNANSVQVGGGGLTLAYTVGKQSFSSAMYDPVAAGVTIKGSVQTLGNISLYDPQNCATTQAMNVRTINYGGGQCTFYLQLIGESFPVGNYPLNLTYNYTNGNQNYATTLTTKQKVNLYGGSTQGLYIDSNNSWQNSSIVPTQSINSIIRDSYGNIYMAINNQVWFFNGIIATQLGASFSSIVNSLAIDQNFNVYAATQNNGIYMLPKSTNSWLQFTDTRNQITNSSSVIGLATYNNTSQQTTLYAITNTTAYQCFSLNGQSCQFNQLTNSAGGTLPTSFNTNALATSTGNALYIGSTSSAYSYTSSTWLPFTFTPAITGQVLGVAFNTTANSQALLLGEVPNNNPTEASVYSCPLNGTNCIPLAASQAGNIITGNVRAITTDGANNVYAAGVILASLDFSPAGIYSAAYFNTIWNPITGTVNGNLQALQIASMLSK